MISFSFFQEHELHVRLETTFFPKISRSLSGRQELFSFISSVQVQRSQRLHQWSCLSSVEAQEIMDVSFTWGRVTSPVLIWFCFLTIFKYLCFFLLPMLRAWPELILVLRVDVSVWTSWNHDWSPNSDFLPCHSQFLQLIHMIMLMDPWQLKHNRDFTVVLRSATSFFFSATWCPVCCWPRICPWDRALLLLPKLTVVASVLSPVAVNKDFHQQKRHR